MLAEQFVHIENVLVSHPPDYFGEIERPEFRTGLDVLDGVSLRLHGATVGAYPAAYEKGTLKCHGTSIRLGRSRALAGRSLRSSIPLP
jgi:hypothetical protein